MHSALAAVQLQWGWSLSAFIVTLIIPRLLLILRLLSTHNNNKNCLGGKEGMNVL